jgi:thiol-disulfide isomerase/thioredoxin
MKRRHTLGLLAAPLLASSTPGFAAGPTQPGEVVVWPEVSLLDGRRLGARDFADRAAVVVFWSTTCPFCKRHNQHLEKLHRAAAGKPLQILAVARDRDATAVARYAQQEGYSFPITLDAAPLQALLATRNVIPLTVTITRQGRLKQVLPGEMFEEDVMEFLQLAQNKT